MWQLYGASGRTVEPLENRPLGRKFCGLIFTVKIRGCRCISIYFSIYSKTSSSFTTHCSRLRTRHWQETNWLLRLTHTPSSCQLSLFYKCTLKPVHLWGQWTRQYSSDHFCALYGRVDIIFLSKKSIIFATIFGHLMTSPCRSIFMANGIKCK